MKKINQLGGIYDLDENNFEGINVNDSKNTNINLSNMKYIAGPISFYIIYNQIYNKMIYLFGDYHLSTDTFKCDNTNNPHIDDATNDNTIYLPIYLKQLFDHEKDLK